MRFWIKIIFAGLVFLEAFNMGGLALASTGYTASGFVPSSFNGEYCLNGSTTWHTQPTYTNGTNFIINGFGGGLYYTVLADAISDSDPNSFFYVPSSGNASSFDPALDVGGSWSVSVSGTTAGSFSSSSGCGTPPTPTSTWTSFGLWGTIASSSYATGVTTLPFFEIVLGLMFVFFLLFIMIVGWSTPLKRLLRK